MDLHRILKKKRKGNKRKEKRFELIQKKKKDHFG